jgi:hypothetical protein
MLSFLAAILVGYLAGVAWYFVGDALNRRTRHRERLAAYLPPPPAPAAEPGSTPEPAPPGSAEPPSTGPVEAPAEAAARVYAWHQLGAWAFAFGMAWTFEGWFRGQSSSRMIAGLWYTAALASLAGGWIAQYLRNESSERLRRPPRPAMPYARRRPRRHPRRPLPGVRRRRG